MRDVVMTDHDIIRWESEGGAIGASSRGNDVAENAEITTRGREYADILMRPWRYGDIVAYRTILGMET